MQPAGRKGGTRSNFMDIYERNRQNKGYRQFRKIFDIAMGLLYITCGGFVLMARKLGFTFNVETSLVFFWALGGLFILYGIFRIYRGFKHIF